MTGLWILGALAFAAFYVVTFRPFTPKCSLCGSKRWEYWGWESDRMLCGVCRREKPEKKPRSGQYGEDGPMDA